MVGAEMRTNIPYDKNTRTINSTVGLQLLNMAERSRDDSEQDNLIKIKQHLKHFFTVYKLPHTTQVSPSN
jgi:hypothetical protein